MTSLFVTFRYPVNDPTSLEIVDTDMKREYIPDVVEAYIQDCIGRGADKRPANELDVYTITLIIDLSNDVITVRSDCGNKGLTLGIMMDILRRLHR